MAIKCSLIEADDRTAVITVGQEKRGRCSVQSKPVDAINYRTKIFTSGGRMYDFSEKATIR